MSQFILVILLLSTLSCFAQCKVTLLRFPQSDKYKNNVILIKNNSGELRNIATSSSVMDSVSDNDRIENDIIHVFQNNEVGFESVEVSKRLGHVLICTKGNWIVNYEIVPGDFSNTSEIRIFSPYWGAEKFKSHQYSGKLGNERLDSLRKGSFSRGHMLCGNVGTMVLFADENIGIIGDLQVGNTFSGIMEKIFISKKEDGTTESVMLISQKDKKSRDYFYYYFTSPNNGEQLYNFRPESHVRISKLKETHGQILTVTPKEQTKGSFRAVASSMIRLGKTSFLSLFLSGIISELANSGQNYVRKLLGMGEIPIKILHNVSGESDLIYVHPNLFKALVDSTTFAMLFFPIYNYFDNTIKSKETDTLVFVHDPLNGTPQ